MAAGLRLELRQSQQLVMTPQLQQAIRLLQMSSLDLAAFVAEEIEKNPLLTDQPADRAGDGEPEPAPDPSPAAETAADTRLAEGDPGLAAETFDTGAENLYDTARADAAPLPGETGALAARIGQAVDPEDADSAEARLAETPTLRAHLAAQIGQMRAPETARLAARALVEEIDERGYLAADPSELAARFGTSAETLAAGLALLQRCEPTGVGARSLAECFALQLAERDRLDPAMRALLDHLDLLGEAQFERLRRICGVDGEDLSDMVRELRTLDPRPGARFAVTEPETLVPDVFVRPDRWGGWHVELNPEALPRVLIDRRYATLLAKGGEETKSYLAACRENASWLVKSLDQRARTILRVASEIVRQQEGFLAEGVRALRPLSLRMVADAIGLHESTVSRVTTQKYISTERGIFELKFFFSNAVGGGEGSSAVSVRERLRRLIEAETAATVLSDDQIVEILRGEGIDIARRTVAKYRSALGIPSSAARRRRHALVTGS